MTPWELFGTLLLEINSLLSRQTVYSRIRQAGGLCIAEEVQMSFGRLGDCFWSFEAEGVVPDIITVGKPLGNGYPLSALITTGKEEF